MSSAPRRSGRLSSPRSCGHRPPGLRDPPPGARLAAAAAGRAKRPRGPGRSSSSGRPSRTAGTRPRGPPWTTPPWTRGDLAPETAQLRGPRRLAVPSFVCERSAAAGPAPPGPPATRGSRAIAKARRRALARILGVLRLLSCCCAEAPARVRGENLQIPYQPPPERRDPLPRHPRASIHPTEPYTADPGGWCVSLRPEPPAVRLPASPAHAAPRRLPGLKPDPPPPLAARSPRVGRIPTLLPSRRRETLRGQPPPSPPPSAERRLHHSSWLRYAASTQSRRLPPGSRAPGTACPRGHAAGRQDGRRVRPPGSPLGERTHLAPPRWMAFLSSAVVLLRPSLPRRSSPPAIIRRTVRRRDDAGWQTAGRLSIALHSLQLGAVRSPKGNKGGSAGGGGGGRGAGGTMGQGGGGAASTGRWPVGPVGPLADRI